MLCADDRAPQFFHHAVIDRDVVDDVDGSFILAPAAARRLYDSHCRLLHVDDEAVDGGHEPLVFMHVIDAARADRPARLTSAARDGHIGSGRSRWQTRDILSALNLNFEDRKST